INTTAGVAVMDIMDILRIANFVEDLHQRLLTVVLPEIPASGAGEAATAAAENLVVMPVEAFTTVVGIEEIIMTRELSGGTAESSWQ
uniref:Uncharacterized protein n=1 Tax=Catagonus wagneri TaxID=51154 RepID=A0A8C3X8K8_9CETA